MTSPRSNSIGSLLIIEDEPDMRELLREVLEEERWDVTTAFSLASAKKQLELGRWDCILLDLHLPDGSADELGTILRQLRERTPDCRPTVILMTGVPETHEQSRLQGLVDVNLFKPFAIQELLRVLTRPLLPNGN